MSEALNPAKQHWQICRQFQAFLFSVEYSSGARLQPKSQPCSCRFASLPAINDAVLSTTTAQRQKHAHVCAGGKPETDWKVQQLLLSKDVQSHPVDPPSWSSCDVSCLQCLLFLSFFEEMQLLTGGSKHIVFHMTTRRDYAGIMM